MISQIPARDQEDFLGGGWILKDQDLKEDKEDFPGLILFIHYSIERYTMFYIIIYHVITLARPRARLNGGPGILVKFCINEIFPQSYRNWIVEGDRTRV